MQPKPWSHSALDGPWKGKRQEEHPCFKHGHAGAVDRGPSPTYSVWAAMLRRCNSPSCSMYPRYGGRCIKVCERWLNFENFLADMGCKPSKRSLDRIDNNGDYEPDNCRWATDIEQARNTSSTLWATIKGERRPIAEWCEIYGINRSTVLHRISRGKWSIERAITTPSRRR